MRDRQIMKNRKDYDRIKMGRVISAYIPFGFYS